jgi:hypothetical protein
MTYCNAISYPLQNRLDDLFSLGSSSEVGRQHCPFSDDLIDRPVDPIRTCTVAEMSKHESGRADRCEWIGDGFAGNIGSRTMHTDGRRNNSQVCSKRENRTHGSPMTNVSPAFTDGTKPSEPTSAAAASLRIERDVRAAYAFHILKDLTR